MEVAIERHWPVHAFLRGLKRRPFLPFSRPGQKSPTQDPEGTFAERVRRVLAELLGIELDARHDDEGEGWQTRSGAPAVRVDAQRVRSLRFLLLAYIAVSDVAKALERAEAFGGSAVQLRTVTSSAV